jgi:protein gp37
MAIDTGIRWTDHTFNPWWGCTKVSPGCDNCYANTLAKRYGHDIWGNNTERRFLSENNWRQPLKWNQMAEAQHKRHKIFCASMADLFEYRDDLVQPRVRVLDLIEATRHLDWQVLTKRPQNIRKMLPADYVYPPNLWLGTTVENQEMADKRIRRLLENVGAAVRFLSCEPLLGPVDIRNYLRPNGDGAKIDWVIVGGEAGHNSRPMNPNWAASLIRQCTEAGVPVFYKQWGDYVPLSKVKDQEKRYRTVSFFKRNGDEFLMARVGNKHAGIEILGREWSQFPDTSHLLQKL